jgi:hypothetical protein
MKYIIMRITTEGTDHILEVPIVFPELLTHSIIAEHMAPALRAHFERSTVVPVRAGFVSSMSSEGECYGASKTLGLSSDEDDGRLISMCDYGAMFK